jgi:hypothetical protein
VLLLSVPSPPSSSRLLQGPSPYHQTRSTWLTRQSVCVCSHLHQPGNTPSSANLSELRSSAACCCV